MNIDLSKIKAKLPRPPKDLSRREILSLIGVAIVLLAIPLTVILFRRYQETRIKAYEDAEIVDDTVKITNIHAHGFTVSWATKGPSTGVVQWGPVGMIGSTSYDDRGADTVSSTHHVTLPHPPGSDEPLGIFEEPNQPFDLKIVSGNKTYGGTFDNIFDVVDVSPTAAPIRVTTGPELSTGLPDGSLSAIKLVSDQNIVAINNTNRTGEPAETFTYTSAQEGGKTVFLPLFAKNATTAPFQGFGSTVQIQNTGDQPANVILHFYGLLDGTEVGDPNNSSQRFSIPARGFRQRWWKDDLPTLPDGFLGSVVVESDQSVVAMVSTKREGGNLETGAYRGFVSSAAAQTHYLPFFAKGYEGYDSNIHIQNTGSVRTYVTVQFYSTGGEALGFIGDWVPPKSCVIIAASELMPPDPVPANSLSSVLIQSHDSIDYPGSADGEKVVATVFNINTDPELSFAYSGFSPNAVSNTQYSPLFANGFHDQVSTMYVHNTDRANSAVITTKFYDAEGTPVGIAQHQIPPRNIITVSGSANANLPLGFLGTARIESNGASIAVVTKTTGITNLETGGFASLNESGAGTELYFPVYANNFHDQISSIQVQNTSQLENANVCFHAYDAEGVEMYSECVLIPRWGFHQFYAPSLDKCTGDPPNIAPGCPDPVYGEVQKSSGVAAPGAIVYITTKGSDGVSSAPLSTVTNNDGRYTLDLGNARTADRSAYFSYERNSTSYSEDISAQGGVDGVAKLLGNPTNNDQPIPTLILNHPPVISPIDDHEATEGRPYTYQVVVEDEDGDQMVGYGLGCPTGTNCPPDINIPNGMVMLERGLISWPNPTPRGASYKIMVWVNDGKSGGLVTEEYTLTVVESVDGGAPETEIVSGPAEGETVRTNSVTFTYTGMDNITATENLVYSYKLDGGAWSDWSPTTEATVMVGVGAHTFSVKAKDEAGNEDQTPAQRSFTVALFNRIEITPASKTLEVGQTQGFTATAYDSDNNQINSGVTYAWVVLEGIGTVNPGDQQTTTFTATTVGNGQVKVTATVGGDSIPAQASVTVVPALNCNASSINPSVFEIVPGGEQGLMATVVGGSGSYTYAWEATGGNFTNGTTTRTTTWRAPTDAQDGATFTISVAITDSVTGTACPAASTTATATIQTGQPYVQITPTSAVLEVGDSETFTAQFYDADGNPITSGVIYVWSATKGNISPTDQQTTTFTAATVGAGTVRVTATLGTDSPSAQVPIEVIAPLNCDESYITPTTFWLAPGGTKTLTAHAVGGSGSYSYTWAANGGSFTGATNEQAAIWQSPAGAANGQTFTISVAITDTATGTFCPAADITTTATVYTTLSCSVSPKTFETAPGGTRTLNVTVNGGSNNKSIAWTKSGGDFVGATNATNVDWKAPASATNGQTFTITATVTDAVTAGTCSDSATATVRIAAAPTLNINLLMQGRPGYPGDSRGSSGTVDIFARRPGETTKLWEVDDRAVTAGGATGAITLQELSVGTAYDFFLKGYIHLTVKKNVTLSSENTLNFGTILVGDLNSTRDDQVNSLDNDIVLTGWQQTWNKPQACKDNYADCKLADFNLDSKVNSIDHDYIFTNWGKNGDK